MRWLVALALAVALASVGVAAYVVLRERDPVPNDVAECLRKGGLTLARSSEALNAARPDATAGELRVVRRWDWGRTDGVLLQGPGGGYAVLALWNADTPSLARGDVGRRVYASPSKFPVVALEAPDGRRLRECAAKQD